MTKKKRNISDNYLETLEDVKKKYQQYVEVSKLYELPTYKKEETERNQIPSLAHPLTTNTARIK